MSDEEPEQAGEERTALYAHVPPETKSLLDEQDGYLWELITEAVFHTYGGERLSSPAAIEREIERIERECRNARERMHDAEAELQRYEQRLEALKRRREEMAEQAETKNDALDRVLEDMANFGNNVFVGHGSVKTLANQWFGGDEQAALDALKERSETADYNFGENRFSEPSSASMGRSLSSLKSVGGDADD